MTPKKTRKPLDDSLATEFVYGTTESSPKPPEPQNPPSATDTDTPAQSQDIVKTPTRSRFMDKLMSAPVQKEPIVRFTVDLTETMHRKLSILAARTGKKKAEIVRMLLDEALQDLNE